jgi:hypothetical protein
MDQLREALEQTRRSLIKAMGLARHMGIGCDLERMYWAADAIFTWYVQTHADDKREQNP